MISGAKLKAIAEVLKKRFTNLTVSETIDIATDILLAAENAKEKEPERQEIR